jgi:D-xylose transport system permease protein
MSNRFSLRDLTLLFALLAIAGYFSYMLRDSSQAMFYEGNPFLSSRTLSQLVVEVSITAMLAVGMLLVILPGHIDLAAGSGVGLLGGLTTVLINGTGWVTTYLYSLHNFIGRTLGPEVAAWCPPPPWPDPVAMLFAIVIASLFWGCMGMLIVRGRIQAFIVTLGGMLIFKGLFWKVIDSRTIPVSGPTQGKMWTLSAGGQSLDVPQDWMRRLTTEYLDAKIGLIAAGVIVALMFIFRLASWARRKRLNIDGDDFELTFVKWIIASQLIVIFVLVANQYKGVPLPAVVFGAVAFVVHTLTRHTRFGRHLYAIGGNEEAAVISGIRVKRVTIYAFILMGVIVAITGFMQTSYQGSSTTSIGDLMELDAVAACVIGGVSLRGGRGTVMGVFLGALIMATLAKGMSLMGTDFADKFMIRGSVLVLAVWLDTRMNRRTA